ncbi:MAG: IclR family transcriptional regulator [Protaetiibacter sp.]
MSAARVADVLIALGAASPAPVGVSQLARELRISKAVVHRILQSLASRELVSLDATTGGYRLGPGAAGLGARALADLDLRTVALPVLRELQTASAETVTVSALANSSRIYLDQIVSMNRIRMEVELGRPYALHIGASGKAILAFASEDLQHAVIGALPEDAARDLETQLKAARETGVVVSYGERLDGAASIASPVIGPLGAVVGSLSVCGPITRFDDETLQRLRPLVRAAAATVSERLAARRPTTPAAT